VDKSHAADEGEPTAGEPEAVTPLIQPEAGEPPSEGQPQTLHASLEPPGGAPIRVSLQETPSQSADSEIHIQLNLTEGARVRLTVEALSETEKTARPSARLVFEGGQRPAGTPDSSHLSEEEAVQPAIKPASRLADLRKRWPYSLASTLFGLALLLYLATRLIGLADFPIYFFSDEAIQTVHAADLIRDGFKDEEDTLLPTYFKNGPFYNLSLSVYLQVLPYLILGKSVFVTRATSVLVSLLAAVAVGLTLRDIFQIPYWWAGTLLLSIAPAWFLHSRTAFETVIFVSFYACFLYAYLLYRCKSPRFLYLAIGMAALAFYAYSPGQIVIGLTSLLLLLSDARYHWQNRRLVLRGLGLLLLLALPYLRFRLGHPEAPFDHLRRLGSYWAEPIPLAEKIRQYASEYLYGLSPGYWFVPNQRDLDRHLMKGYGNLLRASLPFFAVGLILAIRHLRSPAYRAVLIALLVAPAGSALVEIGVTRALVYVIPATILIALGISWLLAWLERKLAHRFALRPVLSLALFGVLAAANLWMLRDALVNGPTWYQDYGLGGMQYGARQMFAAVKSELAESPHQKVIVTHSWANGADVVARYFLGDPLPVLPSTIDAYLFEHLPLEENTLFVMTPEEFALAQDSGKFTDIEVDQTLPYPNGQPGFYFVRLRYVDNIDEILAVEQELRRALQEGEVVIDGQPVQVRYPMLDMGAVENMFDGNPDTLGRTLEANPAVIELMFPEPRSLQELSIIIGSTQAEIRALVSPAGDEAPVEYIQVLQGTVEQPEVSLKLPEAPQASKLRLEIRDIHQPEPGHIHIWEIKLK
jgi:4-amino-4-deoxy-L-arabinose transferase-like glycosyltransferase